MQWIKFSSHNLPPQGLKILCFRKGDLWVARRVNYKGKDYYLEIPYGGNEGAIATDIPDYWMQLDLPEGYTGYIKLSNSCGGIVTLDELQKIDPESHEQFVGMCMEHSKKPKKKKHDH